MPILYLLLAVLFGTVIGLLAGRYRWRRPGVDYASARLHQIALVADQFPKGGVLLLGDSLLEHCHFDELGIVNAGVSFASISHIAEAAPGLIAATQPRAILLAVGANDLQRGEADFELRYAELVALCPAPRLVLAGIPNQPEASAFIAGLASKLGADYLAPIFGGGLTFDEMGHQTEAGKEVFKRRVLDAVASQGPSLKALAR